jgi:hypothetical protein
LDWPAVEQEFNRVDFSRSGSGHQRVSPPDSRTLHPPGLQKSINHCGIAIDAREIERRPPYRVEVSALAPARIKS